MSLPRKVMDRLPLLSLEDKTAALSITKKDRRKLRHEAWLKSELANKNKFRVFHTRTRSLHTKIYIIICENLKCAKIVGCQNNISPY